jgi:hypothetical protein
VNVKKSPYYLTFLAQSVRLGAATNSGCPAESLSTGPVPCPDGSRYRHRAGTSPAASGLFDQDNQNAQDFFRVVRTTVERKYAMTRVAPSGRLGEAHERNG